MAIKGILRGELENSIRMKAGYERELSKLPIGSLARRKINGHHYYYLIYWDKGKVKSVYRGKVSDKILQKYSQVKQYRAKYRHLLSRLKKEIKFIKGRFVEKNQYELCVEVLHRLDSKGVLNHALVIGSWCLFFYRKYFDDEGYSPPVRTRDIDFLVPIPLKFKGKEDIPRILKDFGFVTGFKGNSGYDVEQSFLPARCRCYFKIPSFELLA
ncbi:MAG TPA: hypothetical protein DET40_24220 [Lentisphaeria bacterium]|nr:MAG: hypothetical protein A2X45_21205 [Lentisphaerae bacterium GWF2_50_93]HCE46666.1 hypothetical protein [Lentisphaeria bacterium]